MTRLLTPLLSLGLALPSLPVIAADPPPKPISNPTEADTSRAKELFENGRQLYLDGTYEAAIAAFRESYQLSGDPILLYNIYQCYDRLGDYDGAIEYVEHYRAFAPASERDALTEKVEGLRRRKLREEAEEKERAGRTEEDDREPAGPSPAGAGVDEPTQKIYTPVAIAFTAITAAALGVGIGLGVASGNRKSDAADMCEGEPLICPASSPTSMRAARWGSAPTSASRSQARPRSWSSRSSP
jgi:tetratricopeptide (TPR) repeat protein